SQNFTDLAERSAATQHLRGEPVSELACARCRSVYTCPLEATSDDTTKAAWTLEATDRGFVAQKNAPATVARAPLLQVGGNRLANVRTQRKIVTLAACAARTNLPGHPIDIVECEQHHFARS